MKRFSLAVAAVSLSLLSVGCSSNSGSTSTESASTSVAAQTSSAANQDVVATGDVYQDTCHGVLTYIQTMTESGAMVEGRTAQSIGEEFLSYATTDPSWAAQSDHDKAEFERAVNAGVSGSC